MSITLSIQKHVWPMREPFGTSRGTRSFDEVVVVTLIDAAGNVGRGEGCGVTYSGETPDTMRTQVEQVRREVEAGANRDELIKLLPPGGARCAIDAALWDLEAKRTGISVFRAAGILEARPVISAYTIGIRPLEQYRTAARTRANYPLLKIKVGLRDAVAAVSAARDGAPDAQFIVDPNQAWDVTTLKRLAPSMADLGVVLLEQPIPVGSEDALDGYHCPIPLCADELVDGIEDLEKAQGRFEVVNIKLDKTGGLTTALILADAALKANFKVMVGCMAGSSLAMAPALVLAQNCAHVDLDGPLLHANDWENGLTYKNGVVLPPAPDFWG